MARAELVFDEDYMGPRYRYGLWYRPPGIGAVPTGYIIGTHRPHADWPHGTIEYPAELSPDAVGHYQLTPIGHSPGRGAPVTAPRPRTVKERLADIPDLPTDPTAYKQTRLFNPSHSKEPWQMTQSEFQGAMVLKPSGRDSFVVLRDGSRWLVPGTRSRSRAAAMTHPALVMTALQAGRPVPYHVAAEYPDLLRQFDVALPTDPAAYEQGRLLNPRRLSCPVCCNPVPVQLHAVAVGCPACSAVLGVRR